MVRLEWKLLAVLFSACASDVVTTDGPNGLYHQPMKVDAFNLELLADGTFRWAVSGCDYFGGGTGRVSVESSDEVVLLPAEGKTTFSWSGGELTTQVPEVRLMVSGDKLIDSTTGQSWVRGGVCSVCGGPLGPTGQEPCDDPTFHDLP